jgi:[acyl-carrier-protein] S-malonyltransferase
MGKEIYDNFKTARLIYEEAQDIVHMNLTRLAFEGPEDELSLTANTQPALFVTSMAILSALSDAGIGQMMPPSFFAGHSLGEYTALVASGAMSFADTVAIVKKRGEFMQKAVPEGEGAMAAVLGMEREALESLTGEISSGDEMVVPANYNAPGQIVVSGHKNAVDKVARRISELIEDGKGAFKCILLKVSVPSHSPLMEKAAEKLKGILDEMEFKDPQTPVISNVTAEPYGGEESIPELLVRQLTSPVRWDEGVRYMITEGAADLIEIGPQRVLSGLVKRIDRKVTITNVGDLKTLQELEKKYQ